MLPVAISAPPRAALLVAISRTLDVPPTVITALPLGVGIPNDVVPLEIEATSILPTAMLARVEPFD